MRAALTRYRRTHSCYYPIKGLNWLSAKRRNRMKNRSLMKKRRKRRKRITLMGNFQILRKMIMSKTTMRS